MEFYTKMVQGVRMPKMVPCHQHFERPIIEDIEAEVIRRLDERKVREMLKPGQKIAIPCGSRGVSNIALILKTIVQYCQDAGAEPFIFPAMGSHGGSTAEGQLMLVNGYGVTEEAMGCPIHASMTTVPIGKSASGYEVYIDKYAAESDGIIVVGRIKPHTCFTGPFESGLMKMMAIGLGKQYGADVCHSAGFKVMHQMVPEFGQTILDNTPVMLGVGIVENAYDETAIIEVLLPDEIPSREPELLEKAKSLMGCIYLQDVDLLIVDQIGKNFSGDGADPNISGTFLTPYKTGGLRATRRVVLDLSDETHGNGIGAGVFHVTTKRLYEKFDPEMTYPNALTSLEVDGVKMPLVMNNDRDCIAAGLKTSAVMDTATARVIRIPNTRDIENIWISESLVEEAKAHPHLTIIGEAEALPFDDQGNLW